MPFNIIAEAEVQVLIDDNIDLFTPAEKIDEIRAVVQNLRCHIIPEKVIFQGVLHKQIFFVDEENTVVHQGVDIPFSGFLDLPPAQPGQCCQLIPRIAFLDFELLSPTRLREVAVIDLLVRLLDAPLPETVFYPGQQSSVAFRENPGVFVALGCGSDENNVGSMYSTKKGRK
ncbi:MAG TPA: DUF3794 domain-containing protein [Bacillota bacterium]